MSFLRSVSPVHFEPLSPSSSKAIVPDSDSDGDAVSQSAKRHRIEDWSRQYKTGQHIFIASASIRGPFGRDWENPWRKGPAHRRRPQNECLQLVGHTTTHRVHDSVGQDRSRRRNERLGNGRVNREYPSKQRHENNGSTNGDPERRSTSSDHGLEDGTSQEQKGDSAFVLPEPTPGFVDPKGSAARKGYRIDHSANTVGDLDYNSREHRHRPEVSTREAWLKTSMDLTPLDLQETSSPSSPTLGLGQIPRPILEETKHYPKERRRTSWAPSSVPQEIHVLPQAVRGFTPINRVVGPTYQTCAFLSGGDADPNSHNTVPRSSLGKDRKINAGGVVRDVLHGCDTTRDAHLLKDQWYSGYHDERNSTLFKDKIARPGPRSIKSPSATLPGTRPVGPPDSSDSTVGRTTSKSDAHEPESHSLRQLDGSQGSMPTSTGKSLSHLPKAQEQDPLPVKSPPYNLPTFESRHVRDFTAQSNISDAKTTDKTNQPDTLHLVKDDGNESALPNDAALPNDLPREAAVPPKSTTAKKRLAGKRIRKPAYFARSPVDVEELTNTDQFGEFGTMGLDMETSPDVSSLDRTKPRTHSRSGRQGVLKRSAGSEPESIFSISPDGNLKELAKDVLVSNHDNSLDSVLDDVENFLEPWNLEAELMKPL
ncbi:MAG: hypothetical protein M1837_006268 [Sclerophora amabilis]|nr:MAG: hypothetical protein M1837_006268 [Sclerophora amabilis]